MRTLSDSRGRTIRLTEERLVHILNHPEMRDLESALTETVANPTLVIESRIDPLAELNYRFYVGTRVGDKWLCVVIKYTANDAFVITAYLTDKPKRGNQIWPIK